jgi:hypothetical protein
MAPVHLLSEDLLRIVLQLVIDARPAKISTWVPLTEVCRAWHAIMFRNGAFWAQIWSVKTTVIRRMLVLSLDAPLDIYVDISCGGRPSPMAGIIEIIAPHMPRVRLLHLPFVWDEDAILGKLFGFECPLPRLLENLNIGSSSRRTEWEVSPLVHIAHSLPNLRSLSICAGMSWDHSLLSERLTHLRVCDTSQTPLQSLAGVMAAFQRMPCLEIVDYVRSAAFSGTEAHIENVRLSRLRTMYVDLPLEDLTALCSHLMSSNPNGSSVTLISRYARTITGTAYGVEIAARRVFHLHLRASSPISPTRMRLRLGMLRRHSPPYITVCLDQGTAHSPGLSLSVWTKTERTTQDVMHAFLEAGPLWKTLPIRSLVLVARFPEPLAHLWGAFTELRGVVCISVKGTEVLLAILDALEKHGELFPALERVEFECAQCMEDLQKALERLQAVFGLLRPQLADLFLDVDTFVVADDGRMLTPCARNVAVLAVAIAIESRE